MIYLLTGLVIGGAAAFFYYKSKLNKGLPQEQVDILNQELKNLLLDKTRLDTSLRTK